MTRLRGKDSPTGFKEGALWFKIAIWEETSRRHYEPYDAFVPRPWPTVLRHVGDIEAGARNSGVPAQDVADATQQAAIAAYETLDRKRGTVAPVLFTRAWMRKIGRRTALRMAQRLAPTPLERLDAVPAEADVDELIDLKMAIDQLRQDRARALMLEVAGYSVKESAEQLGITPRMVKDLRSRALADLREMLKVGEDEPERDVRGYL